MSKTAAKQRVSAKRGFANGRGNLSMMALFLAKPEGEWLSRKHSPSGFYNSDYCSLYIHLYLC